MAVEGVEDELSNSLTLINQLDAELIDRCWKLHTCNLKQILHFKGGLREVRVFPQADLFSSQYLSADKYRRGDFTNV